MIIYNGSPKQSLSEVVLFPFDDYSIPFQQGVRLRLVPYSKGGGKNIVLGRGGSGAPDSKNVCYYGSVQRVGDELWMWYLGQGDKDDHWHQRVCFAKSKDGFKWEKPKLGLVEYDGNKNNNLVDLGDVVNYNVTACVVFYEPEDPDPERRFKMAFESRKYHNRLAVAFSKDGLRWKESPNNPVGPGLEMQGGTKFNGCYYLTGQGGRHFPPWTRKLVVHASYDFEHWTEATCLGFRRDNIPPRPIEYYGSSGEQVHLGAALWNRRNVIIGFYGQWHGHPSNDRRLTTMDLGLVVSNDALHYKEPIPDFRIVMAAETDWYPIPVGTAVAKFPALIQGQGFENIGDKTLFWYAPWPEQKSDGVRVASWPRDRLGYFESFLGPGRNAYFISAPLDLEGKPVQIYMNVDGISEYNKVTTEILDERFNVIHGYSREECIGPRESGLRQPVKWQEHEKIETDSPVRIRVNFEGIRPEDLKVYALYVEHCDNYPQPPGEKGADQR